MADQSPNPRAPAVAPVPVGWFPDSHACCNGSTLSWEVMIQFGLLLKYLKYNVGKAIGSTSGSTIAKLYHILGARNHHNMNGLLLLS